jgi:serine/threonine protein kinase
VTTYVLLSGDCPWAGDYSEAIIECEYDFDSEIWDDVSDDAKDLIRSLIVSEPSERLTAEEALEHIWFTNWFPQSHKPRLMRNTALAAGVEDALNTAQVIVLDED